MSKAEPRFDLDLKYGQRGEKRIEEFLDWVVSDNGRVEVKRKRILDTVFYVETHCDKGRTGVYGLSGINVTTASLYCFVIGDTGMHLAIPTELLREAVLEASSKDAQETDGNCPTRGKLVDLAVLLYRLKKRREAVAVQPKTDAPRTPAVCPNHDEMRWG